MNKSKKPDKIKARNKNNMLMIMLVASVIIIAALTVWFVIFMSTALPGIQTDNPHSKEFPHTPSTSDLHETNGTGVPVVTGDSDPIKNKKEFYNILVAGRDIAGSHTDVIMVISYNVPDQEVNILQIPRDTYIIDTSATSKGRRINEVFAAAYNNLCNSGEHDEVKLVQKGMSSLETVVEDTFGIRIDRYVYVDLSGFRSIIDVIGGVEIDVPPGMNYDDDVQDLHIHLKPGLTLLNGDKAEQFVRYRWDYVEGDLGRVDAQRIFLSSFVKKMLSVQTALKLPQLLQEAYKYMTTDLNLSDCAYFAKNAVKLDLDKIRLYIACGTAYKAQSGAWHYSLYSKENLAIVNKAFNCTTRNIAAKNMSLDEVYRDDYGRNDTDGISIESFLKAPIIPPMVKKTGDSD
ncbi:MAG: LCP family protein [Oscillospiraceae bacterium]|nr:LCP family protein [Oscillospiraceae bacterium]